MTIRTVIVAAVLASTTPARQTQRASISPGDQIDDINDHQLETLCTLGYVYTEPTST